MKKLLTSIFVLAAAIAVAAADYIVVVNKGNSIASIDKATLKRLYTGKSKDLGGKVAVPINQDMTAPITKGFLTDVTAQAPDAYKEFWVAQQIKGLGSAPMIQRSDASVIGVVSNVPGAIGYVAKASVTDAVKVIPVQ